MKLWARPILKVAVFLLLGVMLNVAVAWGFSIARGSAQKVRQRFPSSPPDSHIAWNELREEDRALLSHAGWSASIDDDRAIRVDIAARRQFGLELIAYLPYAEYNQLKGRMREDYRMLYQYALVSRPGFSWVVHVEAGWPVSSLRETQFHRWATPPQPRTVDHASALRPPELFGVFPAVEGFALPIKALWPGFAINSVFYAMILWLLFAAPFALRRQRRIKRGLCTKCAYPVGTSAVCTECGASVAPKAVSP